MPWIVSIPYREGRERKSVKHEFDKKADALEFQASLREHSELYHSMKK